jgi:hypothetical protein
MHGYKRKGHHACMQLFLNPACARSIQAILWYNTVHTPLPQYHMKGQRTRIHLRGIYFDRGLSIVTNYEWQEH